MAIYYKISNTNITNEAGNKLQIKDDTGTYSLSNLGGYGGVNNNRSDIALFISGKYMSSNGKALYITFDPYDPLTVDTFNVNLLLDGWYSVSLYSFSIVTSAQDIATYNPNQVYYNSDTNTLVRVDVDAFNTKTLSTIALSDVVLTTEPDTSIDIFPTYNSGFTKNKLNSLISDLLTNNVDFKDKRLIRLKDNYNLVRAILQGALYEFCRGNKSVAQKDIEFLNSNNYVSG